MQCVSCQFENMPGSEVCGRCGTSLALASAEIDVHPPRATRLGKRVQWLERWRRMLGSQVARGLDPFGWGLSYVAEAWAPTMGFGNMAKLVVPGLPQLDLNRRPLGVLIIGAYLLFVLLGVLWFGTGAGSVMLGLAFAVHAFGVVNATATEWSGRTVASRGMRGLAALGMLGMFVYGPLMYAVSFVADPQVVTASAGKLVEGDVIFIHHLRTPRVGDTVLFAVPVRQFDLTGQGHYMYLNTQGVDVDRIVAGPGDVVEIRNRVLLVNGTASDIRPMNSLSLPSAVRFSVPAEAFAIFPSNTGQQLSRVGPSAWAEVSVVPASQIQGIAYWRHSPMSRMGPLE